MACSSIIDNIVNYLNRPVNPRYITAIYEDTSLDYIKFNRTLYFNNLKELLYFPDKTSTSTRPIKRNSVNIVSSENCGTALFIAFL